MVLPEIKRGNSFRLSDCQLIDDNDQAVSLTNIQIRSQLRQSNSSLIAELSIIKHSNDLYYDVVFPDTNYFPIDNLRFDIEYVDGVNKFDTETFVLPVIKDETRPL